LLDWVAAGEEVVIARHGKAVARLVPAEPGFNRASPGSSVWSARSESGSDLE
jgi:antitoxin (DNA-binding transcriptional repressor) of toxin-antitoxin stability system